MLPIAREFGHVPVERLGKRFCRPRIPRGGIARLYGQYSESTKLLYLLKFYPDRNRRNNLKRGPTLVHAGELCLTEVHKLRKLRI